MTAFNGRLRLASNRELNSARLVTRSLIAALVVAGILDASIAAEPSAEDIEFFEKQVRPILVQTCYKCHGEKKQEGGLRLDSRSDLLKGGDNGAAVEPGKPDESLLVEVIGYAGDIKMPPKGKLPAEQVAALKEWVKRGVPWPAEKAGGKPADFDLAARKAKQWAFQPVRPQAPPAVKNAEWPRAAIDYFILARLEASGLAPAPPAEKRAWLRRVTFDLVGLPPTAEEISAFLADDSLRAFEVVIERLLASPQYGERWARHWLDLVRFAETHGHEFDFEMTNAWEYRDYVIRALNADVPYNKFVIEHVAGDLLPEPRRHPTERFNESIIGTGFWFLGEATHSPVDVRADEATRIDNQIDVFAKTLLAQTVACARCHDHKFDAISTKDYYALSGYLQSSRYQVACADPPEARLALVKRLEELRQEESQLLRDIGAKTAPVSAEQISIYLLAALSVLHSDFDKALETSGTAPVESADVIFEDFEKGTYGAWTKTGEAFGEVPNRRPLPEYQGEVGALGNGFVNSHSALDKQGNRKSTDEMVGTLESAPFKIVRPYIHFLIGGGSHAGKTCLNLLVDRKPVRTATGRNDNRMAWATFDVRDFLDKEARIQIVDRETGGWGNIGVDHIVFSVEPIPEPSRRRIIAAAKKYKIDASELGKWIAYVQGLALKEASDPFQLWARLAARPGELSPANLEAFLREQDSTRGTNPPVGAPPPARQDVTKSGEEKFIVFEDFSKGDFADWFVSGEAFGNGPVEAPGSSLQSIDGGPVAHSGVLSSRLEGVLRSRTFTIEKNRILYHLAGKGARVNLILDSYQLIRNPIYGGLTIALDKPDQLQWYVQDVSKWVGHNAYIELIDPGDAFLAADRILFSDEGSPPVESLNAISRRLLEDRDIGSPEKFAQAFARLIQRALSNWGSAKPLADSTLPPPLGEGRGEGESRIKGPNGPLPDPLPKGEGSSFRAAESAILNWLASHDLDGALPRTLATSGPEIQKKLIDLRQEKQRAEGEIRYGRKVMALTEGTPEDDRVHLRGSPHKFGDVVPRRFLEAVSGSDQPVPECGSGRLELAQRMVDPANPLLARVIVNRVWKHHFGEGLVRTPDDFGNMGQPPTHPELLDYLAGEFVKRGWSLKELHRMLVLSRTYAMSSMATDARGEEIDPQNKLWHRMNLRRLEGEAIRDSILAVSGRLDPKMFGPGVMPYLTEFTIGRGRPGASGPLDGAGRRTVYLAVRRNFLNPMLLAFDYPIPFSTIGRRSVSNVPAQALALMNNPFVLEQARVWATRAVMEHPDAADRLRTMYITALGRPPTDVEEREARAFLEEQSRQYPAGDSVGPWADLAHVLFNVKEFIFIE